MKNEDIATRARGTKCLLDSGIKFNDNRIKPALEAFLEVACMRRGSDTHSVSADYDRRNCNHRAIDDEGELVNEAGRKIGQRQGVAERRHHENVSDATD